MAHDQLSEIEQALKERFQPEAVQKHRPNAKPVQSDAKPARTSDRLQALVLPDNQRKKMPLTKEQYIIRENPVRVFWERETRKFLRNLSTSHEHRTSAVMIYEWATGLSIAELNAELNNRDLDRTSPQAKWRTDLRMINAALKFYFGKPYRTHIAGRKVMKAYTVPKGYYITRHRPQTLTLYAEYCEGTLKA